MNTITYTMKGGPLDGETLTDGRTENLPNVGRCVCFSPHRMSEGKPVYVRCEGRPDLKVLADEYETARRAEEEAKQKALEEAIPGLGELREACDAAQDEIDRYDSEFRKMMSRGTGVYPKSKDENVISRAAELKEKYPRAAVYLWAESQHLYAANFQKSAAGKTGMEMLVAGAEIEEVEKVLKNWLPASEIWN